MILHNNPGALVVQGNTLADPKHLEGGTLKTFDYVVANPPFSDKSWRTGLDPLNDRFGRFGPYGVSPETTASRREGRPERRGTVLRDLGTKGAQLYDVSRYNWFVTSAISVRLDEEALRALARLEALGLSRSEAIRRAIKESAASLTKRENLVAEVKGLEADESDRLEMLEVASLMEELRAEG